MLVLGNIARAQTAGVDSLVRLAKTAREDTAAMAYNAVGQAIVYSDPLAAIPYLERALQLAQKYNDYKQQCVSHSFLGTANRHLGNYNEALAHFNLQLSVSINNNVYSEVPWAYINLGNMMVYMKNYSLSTRYLMDALDIAERINDQNAIPYIYVNLGRAALLSRNYDSALVWHTKALEIRSQHPEQAVNIAVSYRDIGNVYFARGWHNETKHYYRLSQSILDTLPDTDIPATINVNLAQIYLKENKIDSALHCATLGMRCASRFKNKSYIRDACTIMGDIYSSIRNFRMAEKYYGLQIQYNDSIRTADISRKIFDIQTMNEQYIQEYEIRQDREARANQRAIAVALMLAVVLGVCLAVMLYLRSENVRNINAELDYQNTQLKDSIAYAQKIQQAVVPNITKVGQVFSDRFMLFLPCEDVSGDFYWHHDTPRFELFAVADSGAQGVPGGCMSMLGTAILHEIAERIQYPSTILQMFRQRLVQVLTGRRDHDFVVDPLGMDISLIMMDKQDHCLYFSGLQTPMIYVRDGQVRLFQENCGSESPLTKVFVSDALKLQPGDRIYLMTPGYCVQKGGPDGQPFSQHRLYSLLADIYTKPMDEQSKIIESEYSAWVSGHKRLEDVTIAGFVYKGGGQDD